MVEPNLAEPVNELLFLITPATPAPSDQELRDILDMLGTIVASVSDRVDAKFYGLAF